jgi:AcrR family transcriptional regulator
LSNLKCETLNRAMGRDGAISRGPEADTRRRRRRRACGRVERPKRAAGARANASQLTRERILACAGRLLAEQGFERASLRMIAKASGITAGAVYKHFESKADLLFEVVKRAVRAIPLFAQGGDGPADATALPHLAAAYTGPDLKMLRQLSIEVHLASTIDGKVNRLLLRSDELAIRRIGELVARAQRAGRLDPRLRPDFVARAFSVFIMGLTHMETLLPRQVGDPAWREFVRDRVARLIGEL